MCNQKFFKCNHCGNFVGLINNAGVPMICCGEEMEEQIPNTVDDVGKEKHYPVVAVSGDTITVKIGSVAHPMDEKHHIEFVYLETENGGQRKCLKIGGNTEATFKVVNDTPLAIFTYCNLHGLWKFTI